MVKRRSEFEWAQAPFMWLGVAETLEKSAHPIFYSAVEQKDRHDKATEAAFKEADRLYAEDPSEPVTLSIDCEEPAFLPAFLLYGYAIENLLKGIYVAKHPEVVHDQKLQVPCLHDLVDLAERAGFAATHEEIELMKGLGTVTAWSGRYPVARNRQEYAPTKFFNREAIFPDPVEAGLNIHALIKKLKGLLDPSERSRNKGGVVVVGLTSAPDTSEDGGCG